MSTRTFTAVGTRPVRHDGVDKVTGRARYSADVRLPGMLWGKILRAPLPHARIRRLPFQQKIGAGLTKAQFQTKVDNTSVRHVGLAESISMIAHGLGWKIDRITDEIKPKIATEAVTSEFMTVEAGQVCGLIQDGVGYRDGKPLIKLHMEAYLGAPESYDAVRVKGSPNIHSRITGGVHGDVATASMVVNSIPLVLQVKPGLHTMLDMPLPHFFGG